MRNFIESVRRKALVVYVGSVKEVRSLKRTKFDINAKAVVAINAVMRTPGTSPSQATIEYSSFDEKTPMLEGGPQYQLRPGATVIIFANSFEASIPPGYLLQGSREELLQRIEALRDALRGPVAGPAPALVLDGRVRQPGKGGGAPSAGAGPLRQVDRTDAGRPRQRATPAWWPAA